MDGTDRLKMALLWAFYNVNMPGYNSTYPGSANFEILQGFLSVSSVLDSASGKISDGWKGSSYVKFTLHYKNR